jgi:hypothetical protein
MCQQDEVKCATSTFSSHASAISRARDATRHFTCDNKLLQPTTYRSASTFSHKHPKTKAYPRAMGQQEDQSGSMPTTTQDEQQPKSLDTRDGTLSPQSSTCVRSTSSEDPLLSRGELIDIMDHM